MRIMITGGGTGGHTSPALAVIEELQERDPKLILQWVGRSGGIEERICEQRSIPFRPVPVEGWPRGRSLKKVRAAAKLGFGAVKSWGLLKRFKPQLVFGVGGYVSLPLMLVAQRMEIPTVIHEQNQLLGMANRMLAPKAAKVFLSFPDTKGEYPQERAQVVGNPVRPAFLNPPSADEAKAALDLDPAVPVVLITGGSQGARTINEALTAILPDLEKDEMQLLWMTGKSGAEAARAAAKGYDAVRVHPFIDDMATACAAADLMVCRAGASSTAEIAAMGKPSILVPYPHATDNHQEQNARAFEERGAAVVLLDSECTEDRLLGTMRDLLGHTEQLEAMGHAAAGLAKPNAAEQIVEGIFSLVFKDKPLGQQEML